MRNRRIPLGNDKYAVIDESDYLLVKQHKWHYHSEGYAAAYVIKDGKKREILMHRIILKPEKGQLVDHINRDPLDNRRRNLRLCNRSQNAANSLIWQHNKSGFRGVAYSPREGKWRAYINADNRFKSLGYYETKEAAAEAYNEAARRFFGEFAFQNRV